MNINLSSQKKKRSFLEENRREITIGFCAILAILVRIIFPTTMSGELFWVNLALFFVFPWLVIRFVLKENVGNFGFSWGKHKEGVFFSLIVIVLFFAANYYIISKSSLRNQLQIPLDLTGGFWLFLFFIVSVSLPLHFFWEFFFRGFVQLGLEKKLGYYALFLQAIFQTSAYLRSSWFVMLLIFSSALAAGIIARQSRSIFYSFISMWLISLCLDILIIRFINQGKLL